MRIYLMLSVGLVASSLATAGDAGDLRSRKSAHTAKTAPIERVSDIAISTNKLELVGRPVLMRDVTVERVAGDREVWVGSSRSDRVLVVVDAVSLNQAVKAKHGLKKGETVNLTGTLERVPGTLGAVTVTNWGHLDQRDATALKRAEVYVYATRVQLPQDRKS
jgi:hypothetical protein